MFRRYLLLPILLFQFSIQAQATEISLVSWNIQDFGKTKNSEELNRMAELVRDADILAIQEVVAGYGGAMAVAKLSDILNRKGSKWDYVISDPTNSPKYATERYAFIWKTHRIKIKKVGNLIAELDGPIDREPMAQDFYVDGKKFTLINYHSRPYNKDPESEISALSEYILKLLGSPLILAGDFNVEEKMPVFNTLKSPGFKAAISHTPTTLKRSCLANGYLNYPIDNIFYSSDINKVDSKAIDFVRICEKLGEARKLSDHLPVQLKFNL